MAMSRSFGGTSVTSRPPISSCPLEIGSSPAIMLRVVVLPHPEGPTSTTNEPSAISRSRCGMTVMRAISLLDVDEGDLSHQNAFTPSSLHRADKVAARNLAIGENEQDHDRDLRYHQARRRQVERGDVAVAVELEHADRDRKVRSRC